MLSAFDRPTRRLLLGFALSALGNGLTLPFLFVYLHEVRGFSTPLAGTVIATVGVAGLAAAPLAGVLVDRLGARRVLIGANVLAAAGAIGIALVHRPWQGFLACAVVALGGAASWPAQTGMLVDMVDDDQRERAFGVQFLLLNAGIGVGGLVAGVVVDVERPSTFVAVYLLDALTFLLFVGVLQTLRGSGEPPTAAPVGDGAGGDVADAPGGYREVLRDRAFRRFALLAVLMVGVGYAQMTSGFPAFAREAGASTRVIAWAFAANTATIVACQLAALRRVEGRRRTRVMALVSLLWAVSWVVMGLAGVVPAALVRDSLLIGALAVFAVGEALLSPVGPAVVNDLAPPALRGRYNALFSGSWQIAFIVGPIVSGLLLGAGQELVWLVLLVGGCLAAAAGLVRLERLLTSRQNGIRALAPASELPEAPRAEITAARPSS